MVVWVCLCGGSRGRDLTTTRATPVWRRSSVGGGGGGSSKGCEGTATRDAPIWRRAFIAKGCGGGIWGGSGRRGGSASTWSGNHLPHSFFFFLLYGWANFPSRNSAS